MNLCNLGELQMENKEKKQMLTTELTKEKSGGIVGIIQDITINGKQTTSRSERNRRPGHLLGHVSTSAERSRTSVGISTGSCAGTKFPARCISGGELEPGLFTVGSIGCIRKGRLRRTRSEDAEMADRGMCAAY